MSLPIRRAAAPVTAAVALFAATAAWAEPNRTAEISAAAPSYAWDGSPVTGMPLETVTVDDTHVKLASAGTLDVAIGEPSFDGSDLDLEVYRANAAGEPTGEPIAEGANGGTDEQVSIKNAKPGDYVIRVFGWLSAETTYKGTAKLKPSAPVAAQAGPDEPPVQVETDATPTATIGKLAKKVKAAKLKGFKGTASDDKGVARVEVALVQRKSGKCRQLAAGGRWSKAGKCEVPTAFLTATGTSSWSFKLAKRLPKGSYTLYAQAVDSAGQKQSGFGAASRKAFKVG